MKKIAAEVLSLIAVCILLTGCKSTGITGKEYEVSGGAVKGNVQITKYRRDGHRWGNDDNFYGASKYGEHLVQWDHNDNCVDSIEMDISAVQWVTNEWLYYTTEDDNDESCLWRVPIEKTKRGDRIKKNKRERLFQEYMLDICCATESCLILEVEERDGRTSIGRYDLDVGTYIELTHLNNLYVPTDTMCDPVLVADGLLVERGKNLTLLNLDTGETTEIFHETTEDSIEAFVCQAEQVYFLENNSLYCYDGSRRKVSCLVTESDFAKAVKRSGGNKRVESWDEIYLDQGNLYFICEIKEMRKWGTGKKAVYYRTELYHAPLEDPQQISREDILLDYLEKEAGYEKDPDEGCFEELGWIEDIRNGKAVVWCPAKAGKTDEIFYDLKEKTVSTHGGLIEY